MKLSLHRICLAALIGLAGCTPTPPREKAVYIPQELQGMDLDDPESRWCRQRSSLTDNFAIFWEKGFGGDLANPPALDGHDMHVDLPNLQRKLERFYTYFRDTLRFTLPGSKADSLRMMVMINYSLEGTAYGGDYDQTIGALWVAPNRIQDRQLNCIAHELGHSFQCQVSADGQGEAWGGNGFFEMASQWMLWQVNPNWIADEAYHFDAFMQLTHKAFLHLDNIYHSPYVLEYWGMKRGLPAIAGLFRQGRRGEDPVMTYKRMYGLGQEEFCDEMFEACRLFVNLDYPRAWKETRAFACRHDTELQPRPGGWMQVPPGRCPENYGFNVVPLPVPAPGDTASVAFCGLPGAGGYRTVRPECAGWRYGLVGVKADGTSVYGAMERKAQGRATLAVPDGLPLAHLYLVVMGAPAEHWMIAEGDDTLNGQWPYRIRNER